MAILNIDLKLPKNENGLPWASYNRVKAKNSPFILQQKINCPYCSKNSFKTLISYSDFQFFEDRNGKNRITHQVVVCKICGLVYSNPWFTEKGITYLFEKAGKSYGHCDPYERVNWVNENLPNTKSVVDIGCGEGQFLGKFPGNIKCGGVEVDKGMIDKAKVLLPHIQFWENDFELAVKTLNPDLVTLFHVLEHISHPLSFLKKLHGLMSKDSHLVVEVPTIDRAVETQGEDLCGFFSISHLVHFSKKSLKRMLLRAGWEIIKQYDHAGNGYRVVAKPSSIKNKFPTSDEIDNENKIIDNYLNVWKKSIQKVKRKVSDLSIDKKIFIWGAGHHTEYLSLLTNLFQKGRQYLILDKDELKQSAAIHGIPVLLPDEIHFSSMEPNEYFVLISSFAWRYQIKEELIKKGVSENSIVMLYP